MRHPSREGVHADRVCRRTAWQLCSITLCSTAEHGTDIETRLEGRRCFWARSSRQRCTFNNALLRTLYSARLATRPPSLFDCLVPRCARCSVSCVVRCVLLYIPCWTVDGRMETTGIPLWCAWEASATKSAARSSRKQVRIFTFLILDSNQACCNQGYTAMRRSSASRIPATGVLP